MTVTNKDSQPNQSEGYILEVFHKEMNCFVHITMFNLRNQTHPVIINTIKNGCGGLLFDLHYKGTKTQSILVKNTIKVKVSLAGQSPSIF